MAVDVQSPAGRMDGRIRACTHLDVDAAMIEEALGLVREIVRKV